MPLPRTQHAVQLVGPNQLRHNPAKEVRPPGPYQMLAKVEAVGLCFSDLKLLKQFSSHARKGKIVKGLPPEILEEIPSYVPGEKPTVPGHEVVCRIVAAGEKVKHHSVGERCLVQTDYRELATSGSNAAFGYNFEGGLQEYVLMDERVVMDPSTGERFLIRVDDDLSASAVALVEPWACVEDSYVNLERQRVKAGGRMLVVADDGHIIEGLGECLSQGRPGAVAALCAAGAQETAIRSAGPTVEIVAGLDNVLNESMDDVVYFGRDARTIERLNDKLAPGGIINLVLGGRRIGEPVSVGIGRVHYGMTRWIGTAGTRACESYEVIPENGEIRPGERIAIIGAAGPMGQMHVVRDLSLQTRGISVVGADIDESRLNAVIKKARPLAESRRIALRMINSAREPLVEQFSYFVLLVPVPSLVTDAIRNSLEGALINIFAGIPATVREIIDLDTYVTRRCYMFGTSGSVVRDMNLVLGKVASGQLDTNCSVDAIAGMSGAVEAIAAVEKRTLAGKIIVYPSLHHVGLVPLSEMETHFPSVHAKLASGMWNREAEEELLRVAAGS